MPIVTFVDGASGAERVIAVECGTSLMQAAVLNGVPGIVGECGGAAICGTCHCQLDEAWADIPLPLSESENEMLDFVNTPRKEHSRLSCQISVTDAMDGMVVVVPR